MDRASIHDAGAGCLSPMHDESQITARMGRACAIGQPNMLLSLARSGESRLDERNDRQLP